MQLEGSQSRIHTVSKGGAKRMTSLMHCLHSKNLSLGTSLATSAQRLPSRPKLRYQLAAHSANPGQLSTTTANVSSFCTAKEVGFSKQKTKNAWKFPCTVMIITDCLRINNLEAQTILICCKHKSLDLRPSSFR